MYKYIRLMFLVVCLSLFVVNCSNKKDIVMNTYQKEIHNKIKLKSVTKEFLTAIDTIKLSLPSNRIIGGTAKVFPLLSGFVTFDPYLKEVLVFDKEGEFITEIGNDGEAPGEFRSISAVVTDLQECIYIYDNLLKRITQFDADGIYLFSFQVKNNSDNIRAITIGKGGSIYLHHAPIEKNTGFVSVYREGVFVNYLIEQDDKYKAYYMRGFLDGNIICDRQGNLYQTSCYDYQITKISNSNYKFGVKSATYKQLRKEAKNTNFRKLNDYYLNSTIPLNIYLADNEKLIFHELLDFNMNSKKEPFKYFMIYDVNGMFLGKLNIPDGIVFSSSNGNNLISLFNPVSTQDSKSLNPKIIIYDGLENDI